MISVHIVRDEEFSTPDHWVCDNQLPARVCRRENTWCTEYIYLQFICIMLHPQIHSSMTEITEIK